ncbi:hypothetical protein D1610_01835 [Sphingomonas gilva]|uniref:Autotransporter domain-containing protein n=1 Tax=Sphingomonas gilva TaxID=2305907 RepID=A0A396RQL8_9SPHN|nr:hypothetical protein [Sphingomonas gilva]RHW18907.1 hypothetical protein D1610_01835 [Sphingomonas gilva]
MLAIHSARPVSGRPSARRHLRLGTALAGPLALALFALPTAASAQDECGAPPAGGGTVTCDADGNPYPNGLFYIAPDDLTIVLEDGVEIDTSGSLNAGILAISGTDDAALTVDGGANTSIITDADGGYGALVATTNGDLSVTLDQIATTGANASGILASSSEGMVTVNANDISTTGDGADGIDAGTDLGDITVDVGTITTAGAGANGIRANSDFANIDITADSITTSGAASGFINPGANGILATTGGTGTVTVDAGDITTTGAGGIGIRTESFNGLNSVTVDSVTTSGADADGVSVTATGTTGGMVMVDAGTISTAGAGADGIVATGATAVDLSFDSITTTGDNAVGVLIPAGGFFGPRPTPTATISGGDITTSGLNADGMRIFTSTGAVTIDQTGDIATSGDNARGIFVRAPGGVTITGGGNVSTEGDNANAVDVFASAGDVDITLGDISTAGSLSGGVRVDQATDTNIAIDVGNVTTTGTDGPSFSFLPSSTGIFARTGGTGTIDVTAGDISTAGGAASGVAASTFGSGDVTVSTGAVTTLGNNAPGVNASSGTGNVSVTTGGAVSTSGDTSAGINAASSGGNVTVAAGDAVSTAGFNSDGVVATSASGDVDVTFTDVSTAGTFAEGVTASSTDGTVTVSGGNIDTTGASSAALLATSTSGNVDVATTGAVTSSGRGGSGIVATSGTGDVTLSAVDVSTVAANADDTTTSRAAVLVSGANATVDITGAVDMAGEAEFGGVADAVSVTATDGTADVSVNDINTSGDNSRALAVTATEAAMVEVTGDVTTTGDNATGIDVTATDGVTITGGGNVSTEGDNANAVDVFASAGDVDITLGDISAAGSLSGGVRVDQATDTNIAIDVGNVTTTGVDGPSFPFLPSSTGIFARTGGTGTIDVTAGDISTAGGAASGVFAQTFGEGDVTVATGAVTTTGDNATAIDASSGSGNVSVSASGPISVSGAGSDGIYAQAALGSVSIDAADIAVTNGSGGFGILAIAGEGGADVSFGTVTSAATLASGVDASSTGGDVTVSGAGVTTTGDASAALVATSDVGDVSVTTTGSVNATGRGGGGIIATSDTGDVTVTANNVSTVAADAGDTTTSRAAILASGANATVTSTGTIDMAGIAEFGGVADAVSVTATDGDASATVRNVNASGDASRAVAVTATGDASATINGAARATGGDADAVFVDGGDNAAVTIGSGGSVMASDGNSITLMSVNGSTLTNAGTIADNAGGFAVLALGGPITVNNSGSLTSDILLTGGADTVNNSGSFVVGVNPDFGAGTDVFNNSGTVLVGSGASAAVSPTFTGLETFNNTGGLIDMRNGRTGDTLTLPGAFAGSGDSRLGLDAQFGSTSTNDRLILGGAASGNTDILLTQLSGSQAQFDPGNVILVQAGAASNADAFDLQNGFLDQGFVRYEVIYNPDDFSFRLAGGPSDAAFRTLNYVEGARNLWLKSADVVSGQLRARRDALWAYGGGETSPRLWMQIHGSVETRQGGRDFDTFGQSRITDTGFEQDYFGGQLGFDIGGGSGEQGGFAFGVTGGYINSSLNFAGTADRVTFDAANAGVYASYSSGNFFFNALGKYDYYWADVDSPSAGFSQSFEGDAYGGRAEAGIRFGSDSFFVEPAASISYVKTDFDDFGVFGTDVSFEEDDGLRGRAGARIGGQLDMFGSKAAFYLGGNYVHEFQGEDGVTFRSGGQTLTYVNGRPDDYGEALLGLSVGQANGVSGFIEGSYIRSFNDDDAGRLPIEGAGGRAGLRIRF